MAIHDTGNIFDSCDIGSCDCNEEPLHEWHAYFTIRLGELIEDGAIDFSASSWDFDSYDEEQRNRFWKKFQNRNYWNEIVVTPPKRWQMYVLRLVNEAMPFLKLLYKLQDDMLNREDVLNIGGEYEKYRRMLSDFPQTMLSKNNDYASTGEDFEKERILSGDIFDIYEKVQNRLIDPDKMLLNYTDKAFYPLLTGNRNLL